MPDLPLVPADYPGEKEWQAWLAEDHLYSKRAVLAKYPTAARAIFIDGFKAAAASRDQRIKELTYELTVLKAAARDVVEEQNAWWSCDTCSMPTSAHDPDCSIGVLADLVEDQGVA